ncbi:MAG: AAA family ATPase, partial [Pirellulales bacterium]
VQVNDELSDTAVARIAGCSRSTFSQIKNQKYSGDPDKYLKSLAFWLDEREIRRQTPTTEYAETGIGRLIMTVCRRAADMPSIGLIVTPSGLGKTVALAEFTRRRGDDVIYIQAGEVVAAKRALLIELATALGEPPPIKATLSRIWTDVRRKLAGRYAGGRGRSTLIVIDEATTLRPATLNMLRNLHDDPRCRPGLVLADTWRMDEELHSGRGLPGGYEQLRSRAGAQLRWSHKRAVPTADVRAVAETVLKSLGRNRRLSDAAYKYLTKLAQREGKLRNVVHRLWACHDIGGDQADYSVAQLDYVADMVGHSADSPAAEVPFERTRKTA